MLLISYQSCQVLPNITYSINKKSNLSLMQPSLIEAVRDTTIKLFLLSQSITICADLMTVTELGS